MKNRFQKEYRKTICRVANKLAATQKLTRSAAFRTAWALLKGQAVSVQGITLGKRQQAIAHLTKYSAADVSMILKPEPQGKSIAVVALVRGKGLYQLGYLSPKTAALVRFISRMGISIKSTLQAIVGGIWAAKSHYTMKLQLCLA